MSRLLDNSYFLQAISKSDARRVRVLLNIATPEELQTIREIIFNFLQGYWDVDSTPFKKYKFQLRSLAEGKLVRKKLIRHAKVVVFTINQLWSEIQDLIKNEEKCFNPVGEMERNGNQRENGRPNTNIPTS